MSFILTGSQHTFVDVHGLVSESSCTYSRSSELVTDLLYGEQLTFLFRWRRDGYGNGRTEGRAGGGGGEKEWESRGNGGIEISGRNGSAYFSGGYTPPIYVSSERDWWEEGCSRATGTRKVLPAAENKLGGFKNFTISASSEPRIAVAAAFFHPVSLGRSIFTIPSCISSFPRHVSCYLVYFVIIPPRQLVA